MLFKNRNEKEVCEICEKCGTVDQFIVKTEGIKKMSQTIILIIFSLILSVIFLPLGLVVFVIGLIYVLTQKSYRVFKICTACNSEDTALNTETPKGQKLLEEFKNKQ